MYYRNSPTAAGNEDHVLNAPLTVSQADGNIKNLSGRVTTLESSMSQGWLGLDPEVPFEIRGVNLWAKLTNGYTYGPYPIPQVGWNLTNPPTSQWESDRQYYRLDAFNVGVTLYLVLVDHVSASIFDPLASDGMGHYYYGVLLDVPAAEGLPSGGSTGQVLTKVSGADWDVSWTTPATSITIGSTLIPGGGSTASLADLDSLGLNAPAVLSWGSDLFLSRQGAGILRLGPVNSSSPTSQSIVVQGVPSGASNAAGADFSISGSQGSGNAPGGSIAFPTAPAGAAGTSQNALVRAGIIDGATGASRFLREARTSRVADYTLTAADGGFQFDNAGAPGDVTFTLPTPQPGLIYGFTVLASGFSLKVTPIIGSILLGRVAISSILGSNAPGSSLTLEGVSTSLWVAKSITGTWSA